MAVGGALATLHASPFWGVCIGVDKAMGGRWRSGRGKRPTSNAGRRQPHAKRRAALDPAYGRGPTVTSCSASPPYRVRGPPQRLAQRARLRGVAWCPFSTDEPVLNGWQEQARAGLPPCQGRTGTTRHRAVDGDRALEEDALFPAGGVPWSTLQLTRRLEGGCSACGLPRRCRLVAPAAHSPYRGGDEGPGLTCSRIPRGPRCRPGPRSRPCRRSRRDGPCPRRGRAGPGGRRRRP